MGALRGRTLDNTLFHNTVVMELPQPERKGRSEALISQRNEFLIARYVYYKLYHAYLRYESMIENLSRATFLAEYTIGKIIQEQSVSIQQLYNQRPAKKYFKDKYPQVIWE